MADSFTPNYNFVLPSIGGDPNTWGNLLNSNFSAIDTDLFAVSGVANAALPKAGGTLTGPLNINAGAGNVLFIENGGHVELQSANGTYTGTIAADNSSGIGVINQAGTQFNLFVADAGGITVKLGGTFGGQLSSVGRPTYTVGSNVATPWDNLNLTPSLYALLASGPTFTGVVTAQGVSAGSAGMLVPNNVGYAADNATGTPFSLLYVTPANVVTLGNNTVPLAFLGSGEATFNGHTIWQEGDVVQALVADGYYQFPGGDTFMLQWGVATIPANTTQTVTLNATFANAAINIVASPVGIPVGTIGASIISRNQISLSNPAASAQTISFQVIGH